MIEPRKIRARLAARARMILRAEALADSTTDPATAAPRPDPSGSEDARGSPADIGREPSRARPSGRLDDMPAMPRITIVTPSYQQERWLERSILSVLGQGYPNLEYVVLDGGSTDASVAIIERHADRLTRWSSGPDGGQAAAVDAGWRSATGEILAWLNS